MESIASLIAGATMGAAKSSGETWDIIMPAGAKDRYYSLEDVDRDWERTVSDPTAYAIGKIIGDIGVIFGGVAATGEGLGTIAKGFGMIGAGSATAGTGVTTVAIPVGIAVTAEGAAVTMGGVTLAVSGASNAADDIKDLVDELNKGDSKTTTTNKGNEIDITPDKNHTSTTENPGVYGDKNSSVDILDENGNIKTRRWYDENGKAYRDVDMTNHGNPKNHPEWPHEHFWDWSSGRPIRK